VHPGDDCDPGGGEVLVVEGPAPLHIDEPDPGAVGHSPRPPGVDPGGGGVLVVLAGVARVVARADRRGRPPRPPRGGLPRPATPRPPSPPAAGRPPAGTQRRSRTPVRGRTRRSGRRGRDRGASVPQAT